jgi:hypothetical protein
MARGTEYHGAMKFLGSILVYLMIGLILGWGILEVMHGKFWLLGVGVVAYIVAFAVWGCLPAKKSH